MALLDRESTQGQRESTLFDRESTQAHRESTLFDRESTQGHRESTSASTSVGGGVGVATARGTVLGHLALQYAPGDERPARRLLELLGCTLVDNGPDPGRDGFCTVLINGADANYAENLMFLSQMKPEQAAIETAIRSALRPGHPDEDPAVAAYRHSVEAKPESISHIGFRYPRLEDVEAVVAALEAATAPGGELDGRATVVKYRPSPGGASPADDAAVAAAAAASTLFDGTEHLSFAKHWIQCFVRTDLCGFGILAFGSIFEIDFVFDPFFDEPPDFRIRRQSEETAGA
jgi:hypothetical protein